MPSGVYKRSEKYKKKVSNYWKNYYKNGGISFNKGKRLSLKHKEKLSIAKKIKPTKYWLGRKMSNNLKKELSDAHKGKKHTEDTKKILSEINKGKCFLEETRKKISKSKMGDKNPMAVRPKELHWCWRGGITPIRQLIRHCFRYKKWRRDIFERDNFTCLECGDRSVKGNPVYLEAHHTPKRFVEILNEFKIETLEQALNCKELWNINKGKTYCKKCHDETKRSIVNIYGKI